MEHFILRVFDFLQSRRRLCMWMLAAMTGLLVLMMSSLKYNENIFDFLPMSGDEEKALTLYQDISGGQRIVTMFKMKDKEAPVDVDQLTAAVDTFAQRLQMGEGSVHIQEVTTQIDFEEIAGITDYLYQNVPLMLTDADYQRMEQRLAQPDYVSDQLTEDLQLIMMPATGLFSTSVSHDPLGLFTPMMDRVQARQLSLPFEFDNGYIFAPGGEYALAMMTSPYGAMESASNNALVEHVDSVSARTMELFPDVVVASTGAPVIAVGNARQIKSDSQWAISIAVTLILTLLLFSLRKVKNLLLIGLANLFGWLFAMAFIAVFRSDVSLIVLGIGSIIIGIAVNYPLHFVAHTTHGGTPRQILKDMIAPLLIGNITTVGAFASLLPLDAPALRDLGLFAAFMLIGTILFVLVFLPHLVSSMGEKVREELTETEGASLLSHHRWVLWTIVGLTLVLGYFSLSTSFDANLQHINYMTSDQEQLLSDLQASAGIHDTTNVYIVTEGDDWDQALAERARLSPILSSLEQEGLVHSYSDVNTFICSADEQQHRIDLWNSFWSKHREEVLDQLQSQAALFGFSSEAFSPFYDIVTATYTTHPFEYFQPIQSVLLNNSFSTTTGRCSVIDVIDVGAQNMAKVETELQEAVGPAGYAFDFVGMNSAMARTLSNDFNFIGFACGFIVFIFLWISFGRFELSLLAFMPMALGWIWILGIMHLLDMQFNIVNVILATFIFGQGDDYTIFITDGLINEFAYRKRLLASYKRSILLSALIMFIGMGSLIVARHPALHSLAEVTIVGMLTVVFMSWIVPPMIYDWLVRTGGQVRRWPVTLCQILRTILCHLCPSVKLWHLWGVQFNVLQAETVLRQMVQQGRGFAVVCDYHSSLDKRCLRALRPMLMVLPAGQEWTAQTLSSAVKSGHCPLVPLHQLPVALAANADLLPLYLHGTEMVQPQGSCFVASGRVDVEAGQLIKASDLTHTDTSQVVIQLQERYVEESAALCRRLENTHYFHDYVIAKYTYKGVDIERETRRLLRIHDDFSTMIDEAPIPADNTVVLSDAGHGQQALMYALVHPECSVHAYISDPDDYALANSCEPRPDNLHYHFGQEDKE